MGKYQWIDEEVIIDFDIPLPIKELISEIEIYDLEDRLMEYVEAWAGEDPRVQILRNESNIGPGKSRNRGLEIARGEYFSSIDPDDYISDDFYAVLYGAARSQDYDIAKGAVVAHEEQTGATYDMSSQVDAGVMYALAHGAPLLSCDIRIHASMIYKMDIARAHGITWGTRNSEDVVFMTKFLTYARSLIIEDSAKYYYRNRHGSMTSDFTFARLKSEIEALEDMLDFVLPLSRDNDYMRCLTSPARECLKRYWIYISIVWIKPRRTNAKQHSRINLCVSRQTRHIIYSPRRPSCWH